MKNILFTTVVLFFVVLCDLHATNCNGAFEALQTAKQMGRRLVVITGIGMVTPLGNTTPETWKNLMDGKSGIGPITKYDSTGHFQTIAGEVKDLKKGKPPEYGPGFDKKAWNRMSDFQIYAVIASSEAMKQAGLDLNAKNFDPERAGAIVGVGEGGVGAVESSAIELDKQVKAGTLPKNVAGIDRLQLIKIIPDMAASQVSIGHGLKGPVYGTCSACASAGHAIAEGQMLIERGTADVMLVGGSESTLTQNTNLGFGLLGALSTRNDDPAGASRPWDIKRDGFVMSEGAGILVLESETHAKARGAKILGYMGGFGMSADADDLTFGDADGQALAMKNALRDFGLRPEHIGALFTHGTSTPSGDTVELLGAQKALGNHVFTIPIVALKSQLGHLLGASAGPETGLMVAAIQNGMVPASKNLETPHFLPNSLKSPLDTNTLGFEIGQFDLRRDKPTQTRMEAAAKLAFGFGGKNIVIIVVKPPED